MVTKQFEYFSQNYVTDDELEEFGKEGWELCGIAKNGESNRFYFKRAYYEGEKRD